MPPLRSGSHQSPVFMELHIYEKRPMAIAIGRREKQSDGGLDAAGKHPLCYLNLQPMTALLWALFLCLLT